MEEMTERQLLSGELIMGFLFFLLEKHAVPSDNLHNFAIQLFRQQGGCVPDIFIRVLVNLNLDQLPCQKYILHALHHRRGHPFLANLHIGGKADGFTFQILFLLTC